MLRLKIFIWCSILYSFALASPLDTTIKVDCHPDLNPDQANCEARGCIWAPVNGSAEPKCYFDENNFAGYVVNGDVVYKDNGIVANLARLNTPSLFGGDENNIVLEVTYHTESTLEIAFHPASESKKREKNKWKTVWQESEKSSLKSVLSSELLYQVDLQTKPSFGIRVIRKATNTTIFDTFGIPGFTVADQFLSITTRTPTANVYGFGEQVHRKLKHDMNWLKWGMFTRDFPSTGVPMNLYGVHPFYICLENDGRAHGVSLINANAQHVELAPYPTITYRTIGGTLGFNIFLGPLPDQVVQQYTTVVGKPALPPYWALGYHLCRWGYGNLSNVEAVLKRNRQAGIPQDAQWIDIDYMNSFYDFTYDPVKFQNLPNFTDSLHSIGMKLVLITDPGIASEPTIDYPPLTEGLDMNVFIIDSRTGEPLEGQVWPGHTYFPDFSNPNTTSWWKRQIKNFHNNISFDGLWIDMNEPSDFVVGSLDFCANNSLNNPPFVPLYDPLLIDKTICMDAEQHGGLHYDLHSLYGYLEAKATKGALDSIFNGYRTFVLSRSTFMGSGAYTAHWLGDNESKWPDMAWSIITCLEFNFFGIPFVGADICGFMGNTTEQLCTRWQQLGAFYPFSRNHNNNGNIAQDPAVWSPDSTASIKKALMTRYKFLPYLNSLLALAHSNGSTVMRPLFFEFNTDANTYDIDDQFLWGSALMIVPILTENTTSRTAYFPAGRWFDLNTGAEVENPETGRSLNLNIGPYDIGLFVRGGTIIPWQTPAQTATASHENSFGLLVALDASQSATGFLYFDDSIYEIYEGFGDDFYYFYALLRGNQYGLLIIERPHVNYLDYNINLDTIQIYGIASGPSSIIINGNHVTNSSQIQYDSDNRVLTLIGLNIQFFDFGAAPIEIKWNFF